ncbi:MAG: hypothetical protein AB1742_09980 [bacterium]
MLNLKRFERRLSHRRDKDSLFRQGIVDSTGETYAGKLLALDVTEANRIYFGSEFCEKRIPGKKELKEVLRFCDNNNLGFTLLTPLVTNAGMNSVRRLLDVLAAKRTTAEIVVNDPGVFHVVRRDRGEFEIVWGRLMSHLKTMPRFAREWPLNFAAKADEERQTGALRLNAEQIYALRNSSLSVGLFQKFIRKEGVRRLEFDPLPQGMSAPAKEGSFRLSLHYPWVYITSSRICEMGAMGLDRDEKFTPGGECGFECRRYIAQWDLAAPRASDRIFNVGNTVFMICGLSREGLVKYAASCRIDRVVFSFLPPF